MRGSPAPEAVLQLLSCECSHKCKLPECQWMSNGLKFINMQVANMWQPAPRGGPWHVDHRCRPDRLGKWGLSRGWTLMLEILYATSVLLHIVCDIIRMLIFIVLVLCSEYCFKSKMCKTYFLSMLSFSSNSKTCAWHSYYDLIVLWTFCLEQHAHLQISVSKEI